jgi:hypothetical protein
MKIFHIMLLNIFEFRENRYNEFVKTTFT